MTEIATRESTALDTYLTDPTGGRLVAWAQAASAANQLAKALTKTSFVPAVFQGKEYDATAAILMGDELGLSPLAALRSIYVVHGSPAMYARTMVALAQSHGHRVWTEASSDQRVIVCGQRKGQEHVERAEWTMDRARQAGYTSNKKYSSNPQEMLYSKAAAEVARKIAADVLAGVAYSVEDLELGEPEATTTVQRAEPKRTRRQTPPVPVPEPELDDRTVDGSPEETGEAITDRQMKWLQAHYKDVDRMDRLAEASGILGRDVASFSSLTKAEASQLIDDLERHGQEVDEAAERDGLFGGDQ